MTRLSRAISISLLLASAVPAFAADTYTSDLLLSVDFKAPWAKATDGIKNLPKWVRTGSGISTPLEVVAGTPYQSGSVCKLHDCASHYMQLLVDAKAKRVWGVLIDLPDTDAARETPSKFARYTWLGQPDKGMQAALMKQVEADPNWK
ncbi:inhibitor of vertebrate lysozyme family protein [Aeromonas enteropelogenes]|uniref:inhibitor of vertebrate lysozyme family protein n=1 Tax=Aeromonas enteropelogenes TaxID=29489 RepID=UPI001CBFA395|nr:inhibitor of vertebrate lysozyme family protein [Aeromonas enteropelogenes]UAK71262.1 inhibitor of vertebrate lysozyme family protein [Aeromonas enteropelogenes]